MGLEKLSRRGQRYDRRCFLAVATVLLDKDRGVDNRAQDSRGGEKDDGLQPALEPAAAHLSLAKVV
jgi:hypothetical protein